MENVKFIGLSDLDDVDKNMVQTVVDEYYGKIKRELNNETSLVIHIKTSTKGGHRQRYDVSARAVAPTRIFESSDEGWDLAASLHTVCKKIITEINHAFHD
ncbi:MAG: hypothetical protein V1729_02230 [Candidatus Woesearchaeota archaeon]